MTPAPEQGTRKSLLKSLFEKGLGEYFILHVEKDRSVLGHMVFDKGSLSLRDEFLLTELKPELLGPCWDKGLVGMICESEGNDWESLTFYGLENCDLPEDLESTRHGYLHAAQNQYGDRLIDFHGSIYRGFTLLLDNHFLPVILLNKVTSRFGETGLAVADLRAAPMPIETIQKIHNMARDQVDSRYSLSVEDADLNEGDIESLFKQYLDKED